MFHLCLSFLLWKGALWLFQDGLCSFSYLPNNFHDNSRVHLYLSLSLSCVKLKFCNKLMCVYRGYSIGCVFLYTGQGRFHSSTMNTLEYVVDQADSTVEKLRNVSEYLGAAKQVGVDQVFLPSNVQTDIDQIETKINSSASTLADRTVENSDDIRDLLDSM